MRLLIILFFLCITPLYADQLIIEPDMGRTPILNAIKETNHSLHLVMYGFTDNALLNAILKQHQEGHTVQIILEENPYKASSENTKTIQAFDTHGISWHGSIPSIRLIHQKTLLIDNKKAIVMTFNFTNSTFKKTRNFAIVLDDPNTVRDIEEHFSADWNHQPALNHSSQLIWSPEDSRKKMIQQIGLAKQSIDIYTQQLNDFKTIGALAKAAHDGVRINILTSRKLRDKQAAFLERAGVTIRYSNHFYIHAKAFIIDQQKAIIGSTNLTRASLDDNRELSVITEDKNVVKALRETFMHDWLAAGEVKRSKSPWSPNKRRLLHTLRELERLL
jgi:cardiolipin synthase